MIDDRIGIIGRTQGVNVSRKPTPNAPSRVRITVSASRTGGFGFGAAADAVWLGAALALVLGRTGDHRSSRRGAGRCAAAACAGGVTDRVRLGRIAQTFFRAALVGNVDGHCLGGIPALDGHRGAEVVVKHRQATEEFVVLDLTFRQFRCTKTHALGGILEPELDLVLIKVIAVGDFPMRHQVAVLGLAAEGKGLVGRQEFGLILGQAETVAELLDPVDRCFGRRRRAGRSTEGYLHRGLIGRIADAHVRAALGLGGQTQGVRAVGAALDRDLDLDLMAMGFDFAEEFVLFLFPRGYVRLAQRDPVRIGNELEFVLVQVVAVGDGPGADYGIGVLGLRRELEGFVRSEGLVGEAVIGGCDHRRDCRQCQQPSRYTCLHSLFPVI